MATLINNKDLTIAVKCNIEKIPRVSALCPNCKLYSICKFREDNMELERSIQELIENSESMMITGNWNHNCRYFDARNDVIKGLTD